jgi:hypothetical protein
MSCSATGTHGLVLGDKLAQARVEVVEIERFGQRPAHAETSSLLLEVWGSRHQENRRFSSSLLAAPDQEGLRVHLGHHQVDQDDVDGLLLQDLEGILTARAGLDVPPLANEGELDQLTGR